MISWEQFTEAFRAWFVPPSARLQIQDSFLGLTQGTRTLMQYETEFSSLAQYAPQFVSTEDESCHRFLRGLRYSLRLPLVPLGIADYAVLVERAKLIETALARIDLIDGKSCFYHKS